MLGRLCSCLAPRPSWKIPSPLCPGYHHCHRNHDHNHHYCNSHNQDYNFLLEDPFSSSVIIIMLIIIIIMGRITIVRDLIFQVLKCSLLETAFLLLATVIIIIIVIIVFVVIIIVIIVIVKENRRKKYHWKCICMKLYLDEIVFVWNCICMKLYLYKLVFVWNCVSVFVFVMKCYTEFPVEGSTWKWRNSTENGINHKVQILLESQNFEWNSISSF